MLPDGELRILAARLVADACMDTMSSLDQGEAAVLREAGILFSTLKTCERADQK